MGKSHFYINMGNKHLYISMSKIDLEISIRSSDDVFARINLNFTGRIYFKHVLP